MNVPPVLTAPAPVPPSPTPGKQKRHGCLLTWLILMLVADVMTIFGTLISPAIDSLISQAGKSANSPLGGMSLPSAPAWVNMATIVLSLVDIAAIVFIFRWKKWGFFASIAVSVLLIAVNLAGGSSIFSVVLYLVSPALLYTTLQIGGENSGWKQLK